MISPDAVLSLLSVRSVWTRTQPVRATNVTAATTMRAIAVVWGEVRMVAFFLRVVIDEVVASAVPVGFGVVAVWSAVSVLTD